MEKSKTADVALTAFFTALICVGALVAVPMPSGVPFTLQTVSVSLCAYCLGTRRALSAVLIYLLLGVSGAPVFSGFMSGPAVIVGKTGGFLLGFFFLALGCALGKKAKHRAVRMLSGIAGLALCHLLGILWFCMLTHVGFVAGATAVSVPFLIKDISFVVVAEIIAENVVRAAEKVMSS